MVKVREDYPVKDDGSVDIALWLDRLRPMLQFDDLARVTKACQLVSKATAEAEDNELYQDDLLVGMEMAQILSELQQDEESLIAAVLYRACYHNTISLDKVKADFGAKVAHLLQGVLQMAAIESRQNPRLSANVLGEGFTQTDNLRKMLVAMIDDVRVALIKIAERTCAIRAVKDASRRERYLVAREVFDIYAPLAHRLGIGHIKWELEDLSFRYLHPNDYKNIAKLLDERRIDRQQFIDSVVDLLREKIGEAGIEGDVMGRAKHIYSIWRKMQRKKIEFSQVYDVRAVRVLVPEIRDCYTVLGIIHGLWRNIPNEFDDYIASPKPNGYRSLHTAVFGPEGKVLEVQIRTFKMHDEAELGVCAHYLYKGTDTKTRHDSYEEKISWLRQVLEWHEDLGDSQALGEMLRGDEVQDRVYVFTPEGHVVDLPAGATPVDFAYRVHTEIGHRCRGARINNRIVPLDRALKTGDQVEIITGKEEQPRRDWLNSNLGYVKTSRARAKIAHWFKLQAKDQNAEAGRDMVQREFKRLALDSQTVNSEELAKAFNYKHVDDMYAAIGAGDLRLGQIVSEVQRQTDGHKKPQKTVELPPAKPAGADENKRSGGSGIRILGVGNLLTTVATCCKPVPGDPIMGYITQGRGVSIHREDCPNLLSLKEHEPGRVIGVDWGEESEETYPVDIIIEAFDRSGLLRDVMLVLANEHINVTSAHTNTDKSNNVARLQLTIEIARLEMLGRILDKINQLPNVVEVHRERRGV